MGAGTSGEIGGGRLGWLSVLNTIVPSLNSDQKTMINGLLGGNSSNLSLRPPPPISSTLVLHPGIQPYRPSLVQSPGRGQGGQR